MQHAIWISLSSLVQFTSTPVKNMEVSSFATNPGKIRTVHFRFVKVEQKTSPFSGKLFYSSMPTESAPMNVQTPHGANFLPPHHVLINMQKKKKTIDFSFTNENRAQYILYVKVLKGLKINNSPWGWLYIVKYVRCLFANIIFFLHIFFLKCLLE